jgi:phage-related protein
MYNKSLQKAVREAIKNIKELSITEEDNYNRKLFQISLDRITKILTKLCKKNKK